MFGHSSARSNYNNMPVNLKLLIKTGNYGKKGVLLSRFDSHKKSIYRDTLKSIKRFK